MFEHVNYNFYNNTLKRSVIPGETEFEQYRLENQLFVKDLFNKGLIVEKELNGIDSAVCMMIEEDYNAAQIVSGAVCVDSSESIGGYSHSIDTKAYDLAMEKNAKSTSEKKYKWLRLFCEMTTGCR